jgi:BASS family bile acid:Na+ symporter
MNLDQLINVIAMLTLTEMMVTIGMGVRYADVIGVARDWRVVTRAGIANYILVPAVAASLLLLFKATPMVAAGFLVAAVCPGAPYGPPLTALAKGAVPRSVGLMVVLAGSSAILAPLLLMFLLPLVAGNGPLKINAAKMVSTLALSQFLPLCIGLFIRERKPELAQKLSKPFGRLSLALNLILVAVILAVQFRMLAQIRLTGYLGMLALVAASVLAGWILGERRGDGRKTLAITTSVRNAGVSLVIATSSFPGTAAITAATAYGLFQTLLIALLALLWGRATLARAEPTSLKGAAA